VGAAALIVFSPFVPVTNHPDAVPTSPIDQPARCRLVAGINVDEVAQGKQIGISESTRASIRSQPTVIAFLSRNGSGFHKPLLHYLLLTGAVHKAIGNLDDVPFGDNSDQVTILYHRQTVGRGLFHDLQGGFQ
jgi:hypothetical protein